MELGNSIVKTPEAETETPTRIQPIKPSPYTNGVLKRHAPLQQHHRLHHPVVVTYKECLKNHAASIGRHAVDGCGEFMPSPASNPAEPTTLICAACGCHRNFHRREPDEPHPLHPANSAPALEYQPHHRHHPPLPPRGNSAVSPNNSSSPPPISSSYAPHMLLALSHGLTALPPDPNPQVNAASTPPSNSGSRKRSRTKFTQNQKDKMLQLAERVGWKMQKKDEDAINEGCNEIGVHKGVFKIWMHNNKNTAGKRDHPPPPPPFHLSNSTAGDSTQPTSATNLNGINYSDIGAADFRQSVHGLQESSQHQNNTGGHVAGTNGASSA